MPAGAVPAAAGPEAHAAAPSTNPVVAAAIRDAARAAAELARSLAAAAGALDGPPAPAEVLPPPRGRTGRGGGRPRRLPHPLPPAIFDDSAEAAAHLMRVGRMLVLVNGYNVTLSTWQDLPISSQRHRLIDACRELAARSGVEVLVVFDGAEEPGDLPPPVGRAGVRWRFSPPDVEADDVLLALVSDLELDRPVTVASSDRRVRDGARALGANAISTAQLLSVLRRDGRTRSG
jgi:predicted RNA-binding protein with PIN domain